jgi:Uma2 family endonuclease
MTQSEFAAWEQDQELRHEFVNGHVYLHGIHGLAGGTQAHSAIAIQLALAIAPPARPCRTFGSDMLIELSTSTRYADVAVTCDERDADPNGTTITCPKLIVEVLLRSTANADLGPKMLEYQAIPTLEEYLVVDSRKRWACVWNRGSDGEWKSGSAVTSGTLELQSVAATLDLDAIYEIAGVV